MLGRLFCFSGGGDADWGATGQYAHLASSSARARVLEVVEVELEQRYAALGAPPPARVSQDATQLRRLCKANLPAAELSLCKELLRKLTAIDYAREAAEQEHQQLSAQLKAAEAAHRQAEFARARAEAIATARGEALMHAQQATRDAEMAQVQLADMLKQALPQLGIDISPLLQAAMGEPSPLLLPPSAGEDTETPPPRQSGMFSQQQLAAVAASISRLPRQSQAGLPVQQQPSEAALAQSHEHALAAVQQQQQLIWQQHEMQQRAQLEHNVQRQERRHTRRESRQSSQGQDAEPHHVELQQFQPVSREHSAQLSGFTVYTNGLQSPEFVERDGGEVMQQARDERAGDGDELPSPTGALDSKGSGVAWRSISSAALSSRSAGSAGGPGEEERGQQPEPAAVRQSRGSRASSQHHRDSTGSLEAAAPPRAGTENWAPQGANKLQHRAQQLPKLVLPGVDASQLDSLVRIGASMQSPDPYVAQTAAAGAPPGWEQAMASQWDGRLPPIPAEARQIGTGPPIDGRGCTSYEGQPIEQTGQQASLHQLYAEAGKVPGAGTWVSPSLAAMIAHKQGHNPFLEGGEPSPPSHIKAVFGTAQDREFYGPMAAHLNKREQPGEVPVVEPPRPRPQLQPSRLQPHSASAESVHGPQRLPPSNRSSMDGSGEWEHWQQQQVAMAAGGGRAAVQQSAAFVAAGSQAAFRQQQQQRQLPPPEGRQAAFLNRFQPMGMYAQQSAAPAPSSQHQQSHQGAPRRSSVAVSQLGGSSQRRSGGSAEENPAVAGMSKASLGGPGRPPRHQQQAPVTKRSLDSMRASIGGGAAAANINTSIHAVEAAMAALVDANPHLRNPAAAQQYQQLQQGSRSADGGSGAVGGEQQHAVVHPAPSRHARTCSLPDSSDLDLPLHALGTSAEQQRREQQQKQRPPPVLAGGAQGLRQRF